MLFDLQTPRRRRVVRVVFGGLAIVFAISFVFLGVGSGGGGFSFSDLFGGGGSTSNPFKSDIEAAQKRVQANPQDANAYATLVQLHYQAGIQQVDSQGQLTSDGEQELQEGVDAWNHYVKLSGSNVAKGPTLLALQTFATLGRDQLNQALSSTSGSDALAKANFAVDDWKQAATVQQLLNADQPNAQGFVSLASFLYLSGQLKEGDQAAAEARKLASPTDKAQVEQNLKSAKQQGTQLTTGIAQLDKQLAKTQGATGAGGATGQNPLGGSLGGLGSGALSSP